MSRLRAMQGAWLTMLFVGGFSAVATAVDLESLVSPGVLFAAHAKEATACADCHERFDQGSQNRLCLRCHEDVQRDLAEGAGFHGRGSKPGAGECRVCHTEHKGAVADILGLVKETFDHAQTDFRLEGVHTTLACADCHEAGRRHRDADTECVACHRDTDPHGGKLGERCESCHAAIGWSTVKFDHATTGFALEGGHREADCAACHPLKHFEETPKECLSCHQLDDVHHGRLGIDCASCHSVQAWRDSRFDHGRKTRFPLVGRHADLSCQRCHEEDPKRVALSIACASCHGIDDDHQGLLGDDCQGCHDESAWKPSRFDHGIHSKYALRGAHASVACAQCHVTPTGTTATPSRCVDCHEGIDVHEGSLGTECASCHDEASFARRVRFDHDLTGFPLLALHQLATCEDCHASARFGEAETECSGCHARTDVHEARLGEECALCHNPNGWDRWVFDHDQQTDFALTGRHHDLECVACHRTVIPAPSGPALHALALSARCDSCHLRDSPHDDAYGRDCERCHVDTSWKLIEGRTR